MNKYNIYTIVLGVMLAMSSCYESFLDVESKTKLTTGGFYKTINDAKRALYACYDGWQGTAGGFSFYLISEVMADECFGGGGHVDGYGLRALDRFDIAYSPSDLNILESDWKNYYAGVYRCNELIAHEEQIDWGEDEATRSTIMGECRAIRALLYFDMVRFWGNIPLFLEPVNENRPQVDPDEVYAAIVADLKYAISNIPANAYPKAQAASNDGHITKYAAQALLARVYLYYTGHYGKDLAGVTKAEVLEGLEGIIDSDEFELVPEFKNLWPVASTKPTPQPEKPSGIFKDDWVTSYAGDGNSETVLAQKFDWTSNWDGNSDGLRWLVMMGIRNFPFSPYGRGWGACTVHPKMWEAYNANDTRREASMINFEAEGITAVAEFEKKHKNDQREYTGFSVKKYTTMAYADGTDGIAGLGLGDLQISQHLDFIVMRYSDVLLMAAELGSPNAKTYLNEVRRRAYTSQGALAPGFTEIEATKENILNERMLEFAFEGQRYWDLLRQGINHAATIIAESGVDVLSGNKSDKVVIQAQKIIEKKGLMQIPYNQITLSGYVLKQNIGW